MLSAIVCAVCALCTVCDSNLSLRFFGFDTIFRCFRWSMHFVRDSVVNSCHWILCFVWTEIGWSARKMCEISKRNLLPKLYLFSIFFLSLYRNNCLDLVLCFSAFFSKKKTVCVVDEHGKESILFTFNEQPILDRNNTVFAMQIIFDFAQIF